MGVSRRSGLRWRERAELHRYEGKAPSSRPLAGHCLTTAIAKAKQNKTNWEETMIARRIRTLGRGFAKAGLPAALLVGGDGTSVVEGKSVSRRVDSGGGRGIKKKNKQ